MNGPQHYRQAENCLHQSEMSDPQSADLLVKQAQVHATLAHVAALVDAADQGADQLSWPGHAWSEATS